MADFSENSDKDNKQMSEIFDEIKKSRINPDEEKNEDFPKSSKPIENNSSIDDIFTSPEKDEPVVFYDTSEHKTDDFSIKKSFNIRKLMNLNISRKRIIINIVSLLLGIVMIIAGSGCIVAYSYLSRINYEAVDSQKDDLEGNNSTNKYSNIFDSLLLNDSMVLNILLFGVDTRKGQETGKSDTIILVSLDTRHKKLKFTSFMRDTYVSIPGYEDNKITSAYELGGADLAIRTVQSNYGIKIDRYAVIDFGSFKNIINALGGIDIELSSEEIDYIDWQTWVNNQADTRYELNAYSYDYHTKSDGTEVTTVHLNGRQALWHARNRGEDGICSGDDFMRTQRQRQVINIIINRLKNADPATLMSIIYEIGPMITTNLKTSEITTLAANISKYLRYSIVSKSLPESSSLGEDFYYSDDYYNPIYVGGQLLKCIVIYDWDSFRKKVADFIFEEQVVN